MRRTKAYRYAYGNARGIRSAFQPEHSGWVGALHAAKPFVTTHMNRKNKKSPSGTAKKAKINRNKASVKNNRSSSTTKNKQSLTAKKPALAKSNERKSVINTFATKNSRSVAKKGAAVRSGGSSKIKRDPHVAKPKFSLLFAIYAIAIIVGLSTILGTTVSIASSFKTPVKEPKTALNNKKTGSNRAKLQQIFNFSALGQEIKPLTVEIEELAKQYPELEPEVFLVDLDTKGFVSIRGKNKIASASTIKLPILVAFFQALDRRTIRLEEQLTMTKKLISGGSGDMQHEQPGTKFSALETASKMMTISDNTATNMLIERLGGMSELNHQFVKMGLVNTQLNNPLPDLTGTNTTSAEDLGNLLIKIDNGELISLRSRDRLLHIMNNVEKDTLLPQGLESGALIAHKTGDIKSVLADAGTVDMPNGKRYIASILVKRPDNSKQAEEFIQKASGIAYQYFKTPQNTSLISEEQE